jgi:hypothetical protein
MMRGHGRISDYGHSLQRLKKRRQKFDAASECAGDGHWLLTLVSHGPYCLRHRKPPEVFPVTQVFGSRGVAQRESPGSREPVGIQRCSWREFIPIRNQAEFETGYRRVTLAFEAPIVYPQKFPQ